MLKNYLLTSIRNLWKDKLNAIINVIGLSLGISVCILILLFVQNELSFDTFHSQSDRIYRAWVLEEYTNGNEFFNTLTPIPLGDALKAEIPEIEAVSQIAVLHGKAVQGGRSYLEPLHMTGSSFFKIFDFQIVKGNPETALADTKNMVITERIAHKYFGSTDVIGETINFELDGGTKIFEVSAVVENPPSNSSITFNILISDANKESLYENVVMDNWFNISVETYVLLVPGTKVSILSDKFEGIADTYVGMSKEEGTYRIGLQPLTDIHLNPDFPVGFAPVSNPKYAIILGTIALLILLIACINFIMLSISRSVGRAKEVGIRKSIGASKFQIVQQFLSEAILIVVGGILVGLLMARLFLPYFNDLSNKELEMSFDLFLLAISISMIIVIGILAGFYPAYVMSNFKPATILKSGISGKTGKGILRKVLIGIQFALSIGLMASTLIMQAQLNYVRDKDLGFNKEQLVSVALPVPEGQLISTIQNGMELVETYRSKLNSYTEIKKVSASSHEFSAEGWTKIGYADTNGKYREFNLNIVDPNYIETMGMEIVKGRSFQYGNTSDKLRGLIVNETFAKSFGIADVTGAIIPASPFGDHEIIGIVKDFNYASLHGKIEPLILTLNPRLFIKQGVDINMYSDPTPKLFVRLNGYNITEGMNSLKKVWDEISKGETFSYQFVEEQIDTMYGQERNLGKIVGIAALLTILIGSLGLFALVSLNIKTRMKELSVRKILGASMRTCLYIITKEYVILVGISLLVAIPFTWYFMSDWLSSFAYHIEVGLTSFIGAGLVSLLAATLSVGYHSFQAVRTRPVDHLRQE